MSLRGKRTARFDDGPVAKAKRRKMVGSVGGGGEEEEESQGWTPRPNADLKISTIYNRTSAEAPAELFRKDLISAMKLPDNEPLNSEKYWLISDTWKQEWERGVQVPVNPDSLPSPRVTTLTHHLPVYRQHNDFKLPKNKYVRITKDENFKPEEHLLSTIPAKADKTCSYDLDNCDIAWLRIVNGERALMGYMPIREELFERVIEELEIRCWDKVQTIVKNEERLGIEFDENVICDVCRSPDCEEGNEMVFCDNCNICVHQACYGITTIPSGSWLCRTCALGQRPECVLCPNRGGAMKSTRSGQKWAHVSCALWIPEVSIGCVENMEPITKIPSIPQSRWALICVLCRERVGACIQCSIKTCKTAYHVTCAFKHGLEMKAIIEDENAEDGVKLRSYCEKHSVNSTRKDLKPGIINTDEEAKRRKRKDMSSEEKNQARAEKLQEIEGEFEKHVSWTDLSHHHELDEEGLIYVYNYWVLKRRSRDNKPLIAPRTEDVDLLTRQQEQADQEKRMMFVQLRQDLERVRNLCYMVGRREKLARTFFRMREQTFYKQVAILGDNSNVLSSAEITAIKEANHGPSIYDRLYSHPSAPDLSTDFETVLARIAGVTDEKGKGGELNGVRKRENPYKKVYVNGGLDRRRALSSSGGLSASSGDERQRTVNKRLNKKKTRKPHTDTSTDDEKDPWKSRSKSLKQMEREMIGNSPSDDSDDLILLPRSGAKSGPVSNIYSDSDSPATSKSERPSVQKKKSISSTVRENKHDSDDYGRNRDRDRDRSSKKNKDSVTSSDLIVPQRQAAKKATESIRSTHVKPKEPTLEHEKVSSLDDNKNRTKPKPRLALSSRDVRPSSREERDRPKKEEIKDDVYDFDPPSDGQDVLAYVPQREAAKKAAEHIKSGMQKPGQPEPPADGSKVDNKLKKEDTTISKKEHDDDKVQKIVKPAESKTRKISKSSVSSGSSSSSSCTSSSSSSSSESSSTSSSSSSSSESEEESKLKLKNHQEKKPEVIVEPDKKSLNKPIEKKHPSNTVRAGIASSRSEKVKVSERSSSSSSSSSSESEDNILKKPPLAKKSVFAPVNVKKTEVKISSSLDHHKSDDSKETVLRKSRKTPDKKLKTSDGRPGLEFQLPPSEREKSPIRTEEKVKHKRSSEGNREAKARSPEHHGPRTSEAKAAVTTGSSSASDKKDLGRKRKSDDKVTSSTDANRHTSKSSHEERSRSQHSSFESKKTDKKIESLLSKKGFDSQSDSLNSILKREIAERREKVSRESLSKNSSKNSIDRIFEKRDKMVRERERKESEKDSDKNETPFKESSSRKIASKSPKNSEHSHKNEVKSNRNQHRHKREASPERTPAKVSPVKFSPIKLTPVNSSPIKTSPSRSSPLTLSPVKLSPIPTDKKSLRSLFSPEPELELLPQPKEEMKVELPTPVPDDDNELPEVDCIEIEEDKLKNSLKSDPNVSLPILSPMHDLSDHVKSAVASIPNLEKADSGISRDFHVCDQESLGEPKKIGGRTTSLSVPYHGRSIFSPQPPSKDSAVELFEFETELLEGVHADPAPLSFTFPQDFLFKGDSKEDNARETLNLVEKLRLEYAKKSQQEEATVPPTPQEPELPVPDLKEPELIAPSVPDEIKNNSSVITEEHKVLEAVINSQQPIQDDPQPPPYQDAQFNFQQYPLLEKVPGRDKLDRSGANQADERWVPPSEEPPAQQEHWVQPEQPPPHENTQQDRWIEPTNRPGEQQENRWMGIAGERWVAPDSERRPQDRWAPDRPEEPRWAQPSASERGGQTEERWVPPSSYHVQSPYINKWAESELMPSRHSETSSASSTDHEPEPPPPPPPPPTQQAQASVPELLPFNSGPPLSYPSCALAAQENWPDPSGQPYPSMLPPYTQPFPAPSFPHGFAPSFSAMVPEPPEDALHMPPPACTAAFTSSQHNMALTAAMVTPDQPPLTPLPFPPEPCITQQEPRQSGMPPTPVLAERPDISPITKKSPLKQQPTRTSTRISTKSPAKSPGISPRQSEGSGRGRGGGKRGRPPGSRNTTRGGGRGSRGGRGRGRPSHHDNTIHSKLIGTVYDFDFDQEEEGESLGDLRSMRERRKSSDRRVEGSPGEILPPRPVVQPLMPGPVDMRTYSSFEPPPAHHFDDFEDEPRPPPSPPPPAPVQQDSRNQLKVKIKGPFLDANYSAAAPQPTVMAPIGSLPAPPDPSTGSNLRRMRKKELLRQYCAQDMNKDYPPVPQDPAPSRNVITIPKAVASMTSIPTRDDYKAVVDMAASMEKKRRKSGHSPVEDIVEEPPSDRRRSLPGISVEEVPTRKKGRGRQRQTTPPAPKLKIKIGGNEVTVGDPPTLRIRPPKKRISSVPPPSLEEMKKQSMKFREKVMADFDSAEKPPPRKEKRKKREAQVEMISANEAKLPKLVIRLGGRPIEEKEKEKEEEACSPIRVHEPPEEPNKPIPIRLTLARCTEGTYVMKEPSSPPPPPPSNASATSPVR